MRALINTSPLAAVAPKKRSLKPRTVSSSNALDPKNIDPKMPHGKELGKELGKKVVDLILKDLDDSKAENVIAIDLMGKTSIADAMVIASGRSDRHVGAIADHLIQILKEKGHDVPRVEGMPQCDWVLIDAGDVIIHVFKPEVRMFYNLEKMWGSDRPQEFIDPEHSGKH